jgi:peptide/nickel transport system permease protein
LASIVVFYGLRITPGNPANFTVSPIMSPAVKAKINRELGLDQPVLVQYWKFFHNVVTGRLGLSFITKQPISQIIGQGAPHTLELAFAAGLIVLGLGIPLGMIAAQRRNGVIDRTIGTLGPLGMGVPNFVLALLLITWFGLDLHWLPVAGSNGLKYLILPAIVLAIEPLVVTIRIMRATAIEQLGLDYVRTLEATGLKKRMIVWEHVFRNSLGPVISLSAVQFRTLLGYTLIVEVIFRWPGLGEALVNAVLTRDYPTAQILALLLTAAVIFLSFLADVGMALADPRLRSRAIV